MHTYIEQLAREGNREALLEEKHRVEEIVYEYEKEVFHILCYNERKKVERNIIEGRELIAFIEHLRVNILTLIK